MNTIDEIKSRLDIVDIVSESVKLKRSGKNYTGFCPFHANTHTPAFVVFPDSGTWRCFGECNEGGDIFRFVMKKEGWDFKEALQNLAERAGVKLEPLTPQREKENERDVQLRKLLEEAVVFYRHQLTQTAEGGEAMAFLAKRGIKPETAEAWGLGYAPNAWDATLNYFLKKGYPQKDVLDAGLLSEKDDGHAYDRFRHRLMFPIRDAGGNMAGFGGRILDPNDVPKFMNSPQTSLFDKSSLLYGLDKARKAIRSENQAVIVEGYLDVIVVHQEGFQNVVSPMGTALTEVQMRQLKRYTRRFVLALDPDAAGVKATLRGLEVAREALDHSTDLVFDARGLLHNEARLQADLRVSSMPDDLDPDEIVLRNPEEWKNLIATAKPIITHVLDTLIAGADINDPKTKSDIAGRILPLINDVPNPVERDAYRQQVARALQVDEQALLMLSGQNRRSRRQRDARTATENTIKSVAGFGLNQSINVHAMEQLVIAYLVKNPDQIYRINRFMQNQKLERLNLEDFQSSEHQQMLDAIYQAVKQNEQDPDSFLQEALAEGNLADLFSNTSGDQAEEKKVDEKRELEDILYTIMRMRQNSVNTRIQDYRFLQDNQESTLEVDEQRAFQANLMKLIRMRGILDKALAAPLQID
ncbi:MAG: DNA primase [Anaerolineae bacterium]|nr:DNA primase [Anaerolineae bacterium]